MADDLAAETVDVDHHRAAARKRFAQRCLSTSDSAGEANNEHTGRVPPLSAELCLGCCSDQRACAESASGCLKPYDEWCEFTTA